MKLQVKLSQPLAKTPSKAYSSDAAFDLYTPVDFTLLSGETKTVNLGVHFNIPEGWYGQVAGRSSLAKHGIAILGGVVDSGYTGPVHAIFVNHGGSREFKQGDRVAQIIFLPVPRAEIEIVEEFQTTTSRGDGGFGSTGK